MLSKYRIVGSVNVLLGIFQIYLSGTLGLFTIPRLITLYEQFDSQQTNWEIVYFITFIILLLGLVNIFLGHKLFSNDGKNVNKYFSHSIIVIFSTLFLYGIITQFLVIKSLFPIYSLHLNTN